MLQSDNINELAGALVKVQAALQGAKKDSSNPFFNSKYADLESVWAACREELTKNGLAVIQGTAVDPTSGTCVVTTMVHTSGQWVRGMLPINAKANDPQGQGSAITYARRYALAGLVGVVQTDDDGESAMERGSYGKKPEASTAPGPRTFNSANIPGATTTVISSPKAQAVAPVASEANGEAVDKKTIVATARASVAIKKRKPEDFQQDLYGKYKIPVQPTFVDQVGKLSAAEAKEYLQFIKTLA